MSTNTIQTNRNHGPNSISKNDAGSHGCGFSGGIRVYADYNLSIPNQTNTITQN